MTTRVSRLGLNTSGDEAGCDGPECKRKKP